MSAVVFGGVSNASLGELLKGYGVIATVGSEYPNVIFWWDEDLHLVFDGGSELNRDHVIDAVHSRLPTWAAEVGRSFQKQRANTSKGIQGGASPLESAAGHDSFPETLSEHATAVALVTSAVRTRPHPLFPALGQDGSANYFKTLLAAAEEVGALKDLRAVQEFRDKGQADKADKKENIAKRKQKTNRTNLEAAVFGGDVTYSKVLAGSGGLYFPDAIKRYATGSSWVHEADGPISGWDFLLAIRGALLLRGAVRGFRGSRRSYSSFPFVFRGSPVKASGKIFIVDEIFLPTWPEDRPRTLAELQMQIRQFQARVGGGELAASAADFRRAVQGRGVAGGFDRFHRFVLERRKPGQRQPAVQAVARGTTVVGEGATDLRFLLARIDESGWLDQLEQPHVPTKKRDEQLLVAARDVHRAVHACADEPTADRHFGILHTLWQANSLLLALGDATRVRPLPPLPARGWERVLAERFRESPEARIARALASIGWSSSVARKGGGQLGSFWPIASQILPVEYVAGHSVLCRVPDPKPARGVAWRGLQPGAEFGRVFGRRWLDAARRDERDRLPYDSTRVALLNDVMTLLRGGLDLRAVHRYFSAFLVLDWSRAAGGMTYPPAPLPVSATYAILRLWLEIGVHPPEDGTPSWDGSVAQCLLRGDPDALRSACRLATRRLRVVGLPGRATALQRRAGRSVACPAPVCTTEEAQRMLLAVLVPINSLDTEHLARRLWVPTSEQQHVQEASHA